MSAVTIDLTAPTIVSLQQDIIRLALFASEGEDHHKASLY